MARLSEAEVVELCTGLAVGSLTATGAVGADSADCRLCPAGLGPGDRTSVALTCDGHHSCGIEGVYCRTHGVGTVAGTMGVRAQTQAVVAATLAAGRSDPLRGAGTESLALSDVEVLEYSPAAEGH